MSDAFDVLVVGAGPAGLAATAAARSAGRRVALVDAAGSPGGQFWRNADDPAAAGFHHHLERFTRLRAAIAGAEYRPHHHVQSIAKDGDEFVLRCAVGPEPRSGSRMSVLRARRLVLAAGAYDRTLPFPGWDLPGVMTAGGTQALLKAHGVRSGQRVVVAGSGPLLLPVADALLQCGARVVAVVEASHPMRFGRRLPAVGRQVGKLAEGAGYLGRLARHRTPVLLRSAVVRAIGVDRVEAVEVARIDAAGQAVAGSLRTLACDAVATGWGLTAQLELYLQLGCATVVSHDGGLSVHVEDDQSTTVPGVWAAGEVTGVGGADLAEVEGELAGLFAADAPIAAALLRRRSRLRDFAAALSAVYPTPPGLLDQLPDDTLVCRCEEVPAGDIRAAVEELGATEARTVKLLARTGMGWCQGRVCGFATAALTARACTRPVTKSDLHAFAERPFAVPLPLSTLVDDPRA